MKTGTTIACMLVSVEVLAQSGPTSLGSIEIGMSKAAFSAAIGVTPVDCNSFRGGDGKPARSDLRFLNTDNRTLCWSYNFDNAAAIENVQVSGLSYDVIEAKYSSSAYIKSIGNGSKAF
jgi:hypothetical protein